MEDVKKSHNEQDLTEQWKKGELPKGYYYAEDDGEELIIHIQEKNGSVMGDDFDLKATDWIKPIAPVPSYEEWQKIKEQRDACAWALDKIGDVLVKHNLVKKKTRC